MSYYGRFGMDNDATEYLTYEKILLRYLHISKVMVTNHSINLDFDYALEVIIQFYINQSNLEKAEYYISVLSDKEKHSKPISLNFLIK